MRNLLNVKPTTDSKYFYTYCKLFILLCLLFHISNGSYAQKQNTQYLNYIERYKDLAIEQMAKYRIPASITLAQGLLESAAGQSKLAYQGNNHFGIKCGNWTGPSMQKNDDAPNECFRVYEDVYESYEDHSKFLLRDRYSSLFKLSLYDYKGWAKGLKACGYATSPSYASSLITIIENYNLTQYDHAKSYMKHAYSNSFNHNVSTDLTIKQQSLHEIFKYNKNLYVVARSGDTFKSIGKEVGISYRKLARANERPGNYQLHAGDVVYFKKKQKRATKLYKNLMHVVKPGESMYSISQYYGIRLKSLYKLNKFDEDYQIQVGDRLRIR